LLLDLELVVSEQFDLAYTTMRGRPVYVAVRVCMGAKEVDVVCQ
jgi:hypothetical protein